jgi:hypothetical protein
LNRFGPQEIQEPIAARSHHVNLPPFKISVRLKLSSVQRPFVIAPSVDYPSLDYTGRAEPLIESSHAAWWTHDDTTQANLLGQRSPRFSFQFARRTASFVSRDVSRNVVETAPNQIRLEKVRECPGRKLRYQGLQKFEQLLDQLRITGR